MSSEEQPTESSPTSFEAAARDAGYPNWLAWKAANPEAADAAVEAAKAARGEPSLSIGVPTLAERAPFRARTLGLVGPQPIQSETDEAPPTSIRQHVAENTQLRPTRRDVATDNPIDTNPSGPEAA